MRAAVVGMVLLCGIAQAAEPKTVTNSIGMELIEIPAGKFTMGSPANEKDRESVEEQVAVTLTKPFLLGKTEVTQGQWQQVMGTDPWKGKDFVLADKDCPATFSSFFFGVMTPRGKGVLGFCDKLTELERKAGKLKANEEYRLPTEAEWEYACRAGTKTAYSFGDDKEQLDEYAWFWFKGKDGREQYHKVGMKKPNPWGLHDMHGNVWEWCSDWYGEKLSGGTDPAGPEGGESRVSRGGSYGFGEDSCRSASRIDCDGFMGAFCWGFRVARSQSAK